jgi:hypothetical protein
LEPEKQLIKARLQFAEMAQAQPAPHGTWVPFTARYAETSTSRDGAGHQTSQQVATIVETRSKDGSLLSVKSEGGQVTSGQLWDSCGQVFSLDYRQKRAVLSRNLPREHTKLPSVPPTGTQTVAGVSCLVYPIRGSVAGTICADAVDDVPLRVETHVTAGGVRQDYLKELTSIDFATPVDASKVSIPAGFMKLVPENGSPQSCPARQ